MCTSWACPFANDLVSNCPSSPASLSAWSALGASTHRPPSIRTSWLGSDATAGRRDERRMTGVQDRRGATRRREVEPILALLALARGRRHVGREIVLHGWADVGEGGHRPRARLERLEHLVAARLQLVEVRADRARAAGVRERMAVAAARHRPEEEGVASGDRVA